MEAMTPPPVETVKKTLLTYALTALLALGLGCEAIHLREMDLHTPFSYYHDSFPVLMWIKSTADVGWWTTNDHLGTPGRMEMADYPTNPNLHMAAIKLLTVFSTRPAVLLNVYFLLSFPLIAIGALAALRALGISKLGGMVASVLYTLLPYHFWRGEAHLFLSCYYMVPLVVLVVACVWQDTPFLLVRREDGKLRVRVRSWRAVLSLLICVAVGFDSTYYPLFAAFFLLSAGLITYFLRNSSAALWRSVVLVLVVAGALAANIAPTFAYRLQHGKNPSEMLVANRPWVDVEYFSLTIVQMLLPAPQHHNSILRAIRDKYYLPTAAGGTPLPSEADSMSLGTLGALGLLFLLFRLVAVNRTDTERRKLFTLLSLLTVLAIVVGSTGGLVTIVNLTAFSVARCFNRFSIFIGLFALAALFAVFDDLRRRFAPEGWRSRVASVGLLGLLWFGYWDQTGLKYFRTFPVLKAEYESDHAFVRRIESVVPAGTRIFQLPYISFLSYANDAGRMGPYSHFRGYIHSKTLNWSFGAMHGRPTDVLHASIAVKPMPQFLESLAYLGFGGIYLDRFAYNDNAVAAEGELRRFLQVEPIVSPNGRLVFYDMAPYISKLRGTASDEEWSYRQYTFRETPLMKWKPGFLDEERDATRRWRWCTATGELEVTNATDAPEMVRLQFTGATSLPEDFDLLVKGPGFSETIPVQQRGHDYEKVFALPPGRHVFKFACNAPPQVVLGRPVVFALYNLELAPVGEK